MTHEELRDAIRAQLQDTGVDAAELLNDNELDLAIQLATDRYSEVDPRQRKTTLTTDTTTTREVDLSSLAGMIEVIQAAYPAGEYPPERVPFSVWSNIMTLDLHNEPAASASVDVWWTSRQLPELVRDDRQHIIISGGLALAVETLSEQKRNTLNVSGDDLWGKLSSMARDHRARFDTGIRRVTPLVRRRLYSPDADTRVTSETTDPGPA